MEEELQELSLQNRQLRARCAAAHLGVQACEALISLCTLLPVGDGGGGGGGGGQPRRGRAAPRPAAEWDSDVEALTCQLGELSEARAPPRGGESGAAGGAPPPAQPLAPALRLDAARALGVARALPPGAPAGLQALLEHYVSRFSLLVIRVSSRAPGFGCDEASLDDVRAEAVAHLAAVLARALGGDAAQLDICHSLLKPAAPPLGRRASGAGGGAGGGGDGGGGGAGRGAEAARAEPAAAALAEAFGGAAPPAACGAADGHTLPPPGHWRWAAQQVGISEDQEDLLASMVDSWRARSERIWARRAALLASLQRRAPPAGWQAACAPLGGPGGAAAGAAAAGADLGVDDAAAMLSELQALQCDCFTTQGVYELAAFAGLLSSLQVGRLVVASWPFAPSFLSLDQGVRELRRERALQAHLEREARAGAGAPEGPPAWPQPPARAPAGGAGAAAAVKMEEGSGGGAAAQSRASRRGSRQAPPS
ncbi:MAG: hypothetical protein J3K34DRAFT_525307 [Monoraphidium minutum]|nr:MAG: hypothetical protein J3K34DRAFT_525307 [Monoraphidium minutum]